MNSDRRRNDDDFEAWDNKVNRKRKGILFPRIDENNLFLFRNASSKPRRLTRLDFFSKKIVVKAQFIFLFLKSDRGRNDADFEA